MNRRNIFKLAMVLFIFTLILFPSCENNIPEEIQIEVVDINDSLGLIHTSEDLFGLIDFFGLTLYKVVGAKDDDYQLWNPDDFTDNDVLIFEDQRLDKNQMLLLEDMEPGIYYLEVHAKAVTGPDQTGTISIYNVSNVDVTVKSDNPVIVNNRVGYPCECIAIEQYVPTFIKLHIEYNR